MVLPWSRVAARREDIVAQQWDVVIVDEAHFGKSGRGADRAVAAYGIWTRDEKTEKWAYTKGATDVADRVWLLTGTPMPNRPIELLPLVKALKMPWAKRSRDFTDRYCSQPNRWSKSGYDNLGAKNLDELNTRLVSDCMLRRTPEMVPGELPEIIRTHVVLASNRDTVRVERSLSEEARQELQSWTGDSGLPAFDEMSAYRRDLGTAKAKAVADWADEWLKVNEGEALVIFGHHHDFCEQVAERLQQYQPIVAHGGNAADAAVRQGLVDQFANAEPGKHRVFIGTTGACGTGMNGLHKRTGCCAFGEMEWTPGEFAQAEGRVRRLGGLGGSCHAFYLVIDGSMENHIVGTVTGKIEDQTATLDATAPEVLMPPAQIDPAQPVVEEELVEVEEEPVPDPVTLTWGWSKDRRTGTWVPSVQHRGDEAWEGARVTVTRRDGTNPQDMILGSRIACNDSWSIWRATKAEPTDEQRADADRRYLQGRFETRQIDDAGDPTPLTAEELICAAAAHEAAVQLTMDDPDRAHEKNGYGWNSADGMMGRILAGIDPQHWDAGLLAGARAMLRKYARSQIGHLWERIEG